MPSLASNKNKQTSASLIARSVCCHILFSRQSSLAYSNPAVSIICKSMSRSLVSVSLRSRVTPGLSCTMAILRPASRLNNVVSRRSAVRRWLLSVSCPILFVSGQIGVVSSKKGGIVNHDRRNADPVAERYETENFSGVRRNGKCIAVGCRN